MTKEEVMDFLAQQEPGDILCLGARTGAMAGTLNALEEAYPHTFNKTTVYATISDHDSAGKRNRKQILQSLRRMTAARAWREKYV